MPATTEAPGSVTRRIMRVRGGMQGVGIRSLVHGLATRLELSGDRARTTMAVRA